MPTNDPAGPIARVDGLAVRELDDEILVYDRDRDEAHCLTGAAAAVWRACDGHRDLDALAARCGLDGASVAEVLERLQDSSLVSVPAAVGAQLSRRRLIGRAAAVAAAPLVLSIAAPSPAAASSHCSQVSCTVDAQCATVGCGTCRMSGFCGAP